MMCYVADAESGTKTTFVATNLDMRGRECVRAGDAMHLHLDVRKFFSQLGL